MRLVEKKINAHASKPIIANSKESCREKMSDRLLEFAARITKLSPLQKIKKNKKMPLKR